MRRLSDRSAPLEYTGSTGNQIFTRNACAMNRVSRDIVDSRVDVLFLFFYADSAALEQLPLCDRAVRLHAVLAPRRVPLHAACSGSAALLKAPVTAAYAREGASEIRGRVTPIVRSG